LVKIDTKEKNVGVTITPSSPPEQKNRAAERCYIAARAQKCTGTKMQSPTYYYYERTDLGMMSHL